MPLANLALKVSSALLVPLPSPDTLALLASSALSELLPVWKMVAPLVRMVLNTVSPLPLNAPSAPLATSAPYLVLLIPFPAKLVSSNLKRDPLSVLPAKPVGPAPPMPTLNPSPLPVLSATTALAVPLILALSLAPVVRTPSVRT